MYPVHVPYCFAIFTLPLARHGDAEGLFTSDHMAGALVVPLEPDISGASVAIKLPGGGRRTFQSTPKPPRAVHSPRVLKHCPDGQPTPAVAQCHPAQYEKLLRVKVDLFLALLADFAAAGPAMDVFESEREHFRMRATFKLWHVGDRVHYCMFETGDPSAPHVPASSVLLDVGLFGGKTAKETRRWRRTPHEVVHYPMGSTRLCELMPRLLEALNEVAELRARVDYASFLTTLSGEALVALTYNRRIDTDEWRAAATALAARLGAGVKLIGRSKNVKVVLGGGGGGGGDGGVVIDETVTERLNIPERGLCVYKQLEGAFSQPNARVCEKMLGWAYEVTRGSESKDLCELYCGNGCFTVALAPNFRRVLATELTKPSVELAELNLAANSLSNVRVVRLSAEEFAAAFSGTRTFQRLDGLDLAQYDFGTLLVDPPRSGLDASCRALAACFARILYVSCCPETLARDLRVLRATHHVVRAAAFDQFPYTPHLEAAVLLERTVDARTV